MAQAYLAKGGIESVRAYYQTFDRSDPHFRMFTNTVADIHADAKPRVGLDWLESLVPAERQLATSQLMSRYIYEKPDGYIDAIAHGPTPDNIDRATTVKQAVQEYVKANPNAIGTWLQKNQEAPHYDEVAAPYVENILLVDPEAAAAWTKTIHDPAIRAKLEKQQSFR